MYTQNKEEEFILNYFGDFKGTLLDIGANDGKTFSNSLALIEKGWKAILIEPSTIAHDKCKALHGRNENVLLFKVAISDKNAKGNLNVSGHHLPDQSDVALLSSLDNEEIKKWQGAGVKFENEEVNLVDFKTFNERLDNTSYDFITIDAEGFDIIILKQIDLSNTKLLCIEFNNIEENKKQIMDYCGMFGMNRIIYQSYENLLICR